ncbi:hypothetical protein U472_12530 [Orenia metallireducens]|uniref:Ion channel n=1 Tax=Orenia metallireducens TaxID=1413210 RepID=A0A1C0A4X6_9FIRM|nr:pentapeptide repeat-containing protein [Orenia metallireducens]OCL25190.1 hypothetical protein U472_12530 [Orenia metallireducens]
MTKRHIIVIKADEKERIEDLYKGFKVYDMIEFSNQIIRETYKNIPEIEVKENDELVFIINREKEEIKKYKYSNIDEVRKQKEKYNIINFAGCYVSFKEELHELLDLRKEIEPIIFAPFSYFREELIFENKIFKNDIILSNAQFRKLVYFNDSRFKGKLDFYLSNFDKSISFSNNTFEKETNFGIINSRDMAYFIDSNFMKESNFYAAVFDEVAFINSVFEDEVSFNKIHIKKSAHFDQTKFMETVNFSFAKFDGRSIFDFTVFEKDVNFKSIRSKEEMFFHNANFEKKASFNLSIFKERIIFDEATFKGETHFDEAIFREEVSFMKVIFKKEACFYKVRFYNYANFKLKKCYFLILDYVINRDVIDLEPERDNEAKVDIEKISLIGLRNLGQIIIDWYKNRITDMIEKENINFDLVAEQYRMLKENFHNIGRYEQEDKAYVKFKSNQINSKFCEANNWLDKLYNGLLWIPRKIFLQLMGGFGTKPFSIFISMFIVISLFTVFYYSYFKTTRIIPIEVQNLKSLFPIDISSLKQSTYHSIITFLTIGYGDSSFDRMSTNGSLIFLSGLEGFIGMFLMSYFTVAFVRKVLR